jgi:hypothetical protein
MFKRLIVTAIMAMLMVAGMVSSAACELACAPMSASAACCPQQMRHCATSHAAVTNAHNCGHPQENPATVTPSDAQVTQLAVTANLSFAVPSSLHPVLFSDRLDAPPLTALSRSSFILPLRI